MIELDATQVEALKVQVLAENKHAQPSRIRIIRIEAFLPPYYEAGTNVGEIELKLNEYGNRAIYGIYNEEPRFRCFMN